MNENKVETIKYIEIRMNRNGELYKDDNENVYNKGYYITKTDKGKANEHPKDKYMDAKIPIRYLELPPEDSFENYDETSYIILKYEYLYYNDYIEAYFRRGEKTVAHRNLENNIFRKYMSIKDLERKMK